MSEVLASLKPYYYYLVGEGIKEIEVRKSMPKSSNWNKTVYFYMSKDEKSFAKIPKEHQEKYRKHFGKVGLKFVCDKVFDIPFTKPFLYYGKKMFHSNNCCKEACLSYAELEDYLGNKDGYGWHISALKIYDKPKELSEFKKPCDRFLDCITCKRLVRNEFLSCDNKITRPPQSWQFVETGE